MRGVGREGRKALEQARKIYGLGPAAAPSPFQLCTRCRREDRSRRGKLANVLDETFNVTCRVSPLKLTYGERIWGGVRGIVKALGFRQFRVRFHGELVRIEIAKDELEKALTVEMAAKFTAIFKPLSFHYVTIDLEGYRQGSFNAVLNRG